MGAPKADGYLIVPIVDKDGEHYLERVIAALLDAGLVCPDTGAVYGKDGLTCDTLARSIITFLEGGDE